MCRRAELSHRTEGLNARDLRGLMPSISTPVGKAHDIDIPRVLSAHNVSAHPTMTMRSSAMIDECKTSVSGNEGHCSILLTHYSASVFCLPAAAVCSGCVKCLCVVAV